MKKIARAVAAAAMVGWLFAVVSPAGATAEPVQTICTISGDDVLGTTITIPRPTRTAVWTVEIDRNGRTLVSTGQSAGYAHAHDGETYRIYLNGVLWDSGVGVGNEGDCGGGTTEPPGTTIPPTTTSPPTTEPPGTTRPPIDACEDDGVECPPNGPTTTVAPTTTDAPVTTVPVEPPDDGGSAPRGGPQGQPAEELPATGLSPELTMLAVLGAIVLTVGGAILYGTRIRRFEG